jgi:hypothetical protein
VLAVQARLVLATTATIRSFRPSHQLAAAKAVVTIRKMAPAVALAVVAVVVR